MKLSKKANRQLAELFPDFLSDDDRMNLRSWESSNKDSDGLLVPSTDLILPDDFDIRTIMREAEDPITGTLRDLKVDDRDLPLAKNFYDFAINIIGKDSNPPWARQMWTGLMLFGEVCPCCSKKSWLDITNVPKDYKSKDMPEHLQLLEHGICPKCKRTKPELIKNFNLKAYIELVLVWGQRCLVGSTLVLTENGIERIGDIGRNRPYGFSSMSMGVHNGRELETTSKFYVGRPERTVGISFSNGYWLEGTKDHPIRVMNKGFVTLKNVKASDLVVLRINQQQFGNYVPDLNTLITNIVNDKTIKSTVTPNFKKAIADSSLYRLLGYWVSEGRGEFISNNDPEVLSDVVAAWCKLVDKSLVTRELHGVTVHGRHAHKLLADLLGRTVEELRAGSAKQQVPNMVLTTKKEYQASFLAALFEGDGSVGFITKGTPEVSYASISKQLILDVSAMLNNMGIYHTLRQRDSWATNGSVNQVSKPYWIISIRGLYVKKFALQIGFTCSRKQGILLKAAAHEVTNKVPHAYENLTFLRQQVADFMIEHRQSLFDIGLNIKKVFPESTIRKLISDPNRALTKDKLKIIIDRYARLGIDASRFSKFVSDDVIVVSVVEKYAGTYEKTYDFTLPKTHQFMSNSVLSHNSGKSESAAFFSSYQLHRYLKFPKLSTLTQALQASTPLTATFVSLTFTKAVSLLWTPVYNKIQSSSWFKEYHSMLDYYGNKSGQELYRVKDLFIKYHHKGLHLYPSHPNGPVLRGDTRILSAVDELGLFPLPNARDGDDSEDEQSARANADEAHKSLTNSLTTVQAVNQQLLKQGYTSAPTALMMGVSSPMSERDKVMRLLRESKTEQGSKLILGIQLPTWEVNPYIDRDHPIISLAYERNTAKAERDFGANPPRVHSTYIDQKLVEDGIFIGAPNSHELVHQFDSVGEIYGTLRKLFTVTQPSLLTIDAGYSNNAFAIVAGHYDFIAGKTVITTLLECVPRDGRVINFNLLYKNAILPLAKELTAVALIGDRWNSLDLLHRVKDDCGLKPDGKPVTVSKQFSPRRKDFDMVYSMIRDKTLVLPRLDPQDKKLVLEQGVENYKVDLVNKPVAHLLLQLITVKDTNDRLPPEKGDGYTDDLFRAMVLNAALIHEPKIMEMLKTAKALNTKSSGMPKPASAGRSGFSRGYGGLR